MSVYLLFSWKSLAALRLFFDQTGGEGKKLYGPMRVLSSRNAQGEIVETNRTLALLSPELVGVLTELGYDRRQRRGDFSFSPYELRKSDFDGGNRRLFLPLPPGEAADLSAARAEEALTEEMARLVDFRLLPEGSWKIQMPLLSRRSGLPRSGIYLSFSPSVPLEAIARTRLLLNDLYSPSAEISFRCLWARKKKNRGKGRGTEEEAERSATEEEAERSPTEEEAERSPTEEGKRSGAKK